MSNKTVMQPDDAETVNEMIDDLIVRNGDANKSELQRELIAELQHMAASGDGWADRVILALAEDGCEGRIHARLKADRGVVRIAHSGAVISMPTRFGVPRITETGQREKAFQPMLWWELSWDRFDQLIISLMRQRNILSERIAALQEILQLRDQFPAAETPGEACEMAGIDPRQFGIERVA